MEIYSTLNRVNNENVVREMHIPIPVPDKLSKVFSVRDGAPLAVVVNLDSYALVRLRERRAYTSVIHQLPDRRSKFDWKQNVDN